MLIDKLKAALEKSENLPNSKLLIRDIKLLEWFSKREAKILAEIISYLSQNKMTDKIISYKGKLYNLLNISGQQVKGIYSIKESMESFKYFAPYLKLEEDKSKVTGILTILLNYCASLAELTYLTGDESSVYISVDRKAILDNVKIEYVQSLKFIKKIRLINTIS